MTTTTKLEQLLGWMDSAEYAPTYGELREKVKELITEEQQVKNCLIADVVGSLPLIEIDKETLQMCVEMYKSGDKITAVKWLMEEAKKDTYTFGIKWASEYLEKQ